MDLTDIIMIIAVFSGPIIAVRVTRYLDDQNNIRLRKIEIFKTLMATRAYSASWRHVEALNLIDLEFDPSIAKEKAVITAWKEYLDLLGNVEMNPDQWAQRRVDLLVELLHKMAQVLKYDFDKVHIKNSSYSPRIHGETEEEQQIIRKFTKEVLEGKRPIPMAVVNWPSTEER